MSRKYKLPIIMLTTLLVLSLSISTGYGLYKIINEEKDYIVYQENCFEIVANSKEININNLAVYNDDNGKISEPYTLAISNTCDTKQDIELRLNILPGSEVNTKELKVHINGDFKLEPTIYSSLINSGNNKNPENLFSKILGSIELAPESTKRINIRTWIDDTKASSEEQELIAKIEFSTTKTSIKPFFKQTLLSNNAIINSSNPIDFSLAETTIPLLSNTLDEDGTSYYFRGPVTNNYVSFANMLWQVVRINGDGSVRLIYFSDTYDNIVFNTTNTESKHLGFTYLNGEEEVSSTIKEYLDTWYDTNLKAYDEYIATSKFCNDTSYTESLGQSNLVTSNRLINNTPSLICPKTQSTYGGTYETKIGLITLDEVIFAGGSSNTENMAYYLYSDYIYYTMSPSRTYYTTSYMYIVNNYGTIRDLAVNQAVAVRPVISLEGNVTVTGSGTISDPYKIDQFEN